MTRIIAAVFVAAVFVSMPASAQQPDPALLPFDAAAERMNRQPPDLDRSGRIFFGESATQGAFPFVVALIRGNAGPEETTMFEAHFCGGTIIAAQWILTAAHCAQKNKAGVTVPIGPSEVDVYVGSVNFRGGRRLKVKNVIVHPDYRHGRNDNDVALLQLADFVPSAGGTMIPILNAEQEGKLQASGTDVIAAGWGETETGDYPKTLRYVRMKIIDTGICNANIAKYREDIAWRSLRDLRKQLDLEDDAVGEINDILKKQITRPVSDRMICSGQPNRPHDACQGDSGGPLFTETSPGQFAQVGVTSWGIGCGLGEKFGLHGIYARTSRFIEWIRRTAR